MVKSIRRTTIRIYAGTITLAIVLSFSLIRTEAGSHLNKLSPGTLQDLQIIQRLANNPCLLNTNYLDCYLGPRASAITAPFSKSLRSSAPVFRTFWHDQNGLSVAYKLETSTVSQDNFLAEFQCALTPNNDVRLDDLDKILNEEAKYSLDEEGRSDLTYSIKPKDQNIRFLQSNSQQNDVSTTKVLVYQDTNLINITRIVVQYNGPPLVLPSAQDMEEANTFRHDNALEHHRLGQHQQAQRLLQSHIQSHPGDAEAHLKLAESYRAQSCINQSIAEYKIALSKCGDNANLRNKCLEGLQQLKVTVPVQKPVQYLSPPTRINVNPPPINSTNFISSPNNIKNPDVGF